MRASLALCAILSGCAAGAPAAKPGDAGAGGPQAICPAHPEQCSGKCCGTSCIETALDPLNCGACGNTCTMGTVCSAGHCGCPPNGLPCGSGQTCCGSLGCVSLDSDIRNCGACGNQCGNGATCVSGACQCGGKSCNAGETCCNGACAASCGGMSVVDMATAGGVPAGSCACSDQCASDPTHECVDTNCCWFAAFFLQTCTPTASCAPYIYK